MAFYNKPLNKNKKIWRKIYLYHSKTQTENSSLTLIPDYPSARYWPGFRKLIF